MPVPGRDGWGYRTYDVDLIMGVNGRLGLGSQLQNERFIRVSGDVILKFARLSTYSEAVFPARAARFAGTYGLLGLCAHLKPLFHGSECQPLANNVAALPALWEPLDAWRRYSAQVRAIANSLARLQRGEAPTKEEWKAIAAGDPEVMPPTIGQTEGHCDTQHADSPPDFAFVTEAWQSTSDHRTALLLGRRLISRVIERWVAYGAVELELNWLPNADYPRARIHSEGLAGSLGIGLLALAQSGVYECRNCRKLFTGENRARRPSNTRRAYCDQRCSADRYLARNRNPKAPTVG
jgi:hypothetical protein